MPRFQSDFYRAWLRGERAKQRGQHIHDAIASYSGKLVTEIIVDEALPDDVMLGYDPAVPGTLSMLHSNGEIHIYQRDDDGEWKEIVRDRAYAPLPLEEEVEGDWFGVALAAFFIAFGVCVILYSLVQWGVL